MKRILTTAAPFLAAATLLSAEAPAPSDVVFDEYGAVELSLTGVAGEAANGEKVMTSRGKGNCIACHAVSSLSDYPFHGEVGPSLDGAAERWNEAQLRGIVADAKRTFPESVMISFYKNEGYIRPGDGFTGKAAPAEGLQPILTAQEIEDVVAYLVTLKE